MKTIRRTTFVIALLTAAPSLALSQASKQRASTLLDLRSTSVSGEDPSQWSARQRQFESGLSELATQPVPSASDLSPEAEIVRIARDRAARPKVYREFVDYYARSVDRSFHVPKTTLPRSEHLTEHYRFVWEFLYLRPSETTDAPGYSGRASDAMAAIGHDASVHLVMRRFRKLGKGDASLQGQMEEKMVSTLGKYYTSAALDALLECVTGSTLQSDQSVVPKGFRMDLAHKVRDQLQPRSRTSAERWSIVIKDYEADPTKKLKIMLLRSILARKSP